MLGQPPPLSGTPEVPRRFSNVIDQTCPVIRSEDCSPPRGEQPQAKDPYVQFSFVSRSVLRGSRFFPRQTAIQARNRPTSSSSPSTPKIQLFNSPSAT